MLAGSIILNTRTGMAPDLRAGVRHTSGATAAYHLTWYRVEFPILFPPVTIASLHRDNGNLGSIAASSCFFRSKLLRARVYREAWLVVLLNSAEEIS